MFIWFTVERKACCYDKSKGFIVSARAAGQENINGYNAG